MDLPFQKASSKMFFLGNFKMAMAPRTRLREPEARILALRIAATFPNQRSDDNGS
jgi:hypothetical protein